jgi:aminoglycoside phosphotransferase family enzyme
VSTIDSGNGGTREKVTFLRSAGAHARSDRVTAIETHFAWVVLAGDAAYKLKKPLRRGSMDYSTLARRRGACLAELRLNRRLAPSVYLEVLPLCRRRDGRLTLAGGGRVVDWLLKMRRLPAQRMLDRALLAESASTADVAAVARLLCGFFRSARGEPLSPVAYLRRLARQAARSGRELRMPDLRLDGNLVRQVTGAQLRFISEAASLLAPRAALLLDGHGDLRPEHVFLGSPSQVPCVIDCLEFDRDLRRLDPLEEMAFLMLECERLGGRTVARELLRYYRQMLPDAAPASLVDFYRSRRAANRALIAAWHLRDKRFARQPRRYRSLAHGYLREALRFAQRALAGAPFEPDASRRTCRLAA